MHLSAWQGFAVDSEFTKSMEAAYAATDAYPRGADEDDASGAGDSGTEVLTRRAREAAQRDAVAQAQRRHLARRGSADKDGATTEGERGAEAVAGSCTRGGSAPAERAVAQTARLDPPGRRDQRIATRSADQEEIARTQERATEVACGFVAREGQDERAAAYVPGAHQAAAAQRERSADDEKAAAEGEGRAEAGTGHRVGRGVGERPEQSPAPVEHRNGSASGRRDGDESRVDRHGRTESVTRTGGGIRQRDERLAGRTVDDRGCAGFVLGGRAVDQATAVRRECDAVLRPGCEWAAPPALDPGTRCHRPRRRRPSESRCEERGENAVLRPRRRPATGPGLGRTPLLSLLPNSQAPLKDTRTHLR